MRVDLNPLVKLEQSSRARHMAGSPNRQYSCMQKPFCKQPQSCKLVLSFENSEGESHIPLPTLELCPPCQSWSYVSMHYVGRLEVSLGIRGNFSEKGGFLTPVEAKTGRSPGLSFQSVFLNQ